MSKKSSLNKEEIAFNEASDLWNKTFREPFSKWEISIKNQENKEINIQQNFDKMHDYDDANLLYYNPLQYINDYVASLLDQVKMKKILDGDNKV